MRCTIGVFSLVLLIVIGGCGTKKEEPKKNAATTAPAQPPGPVSTDQMTPEEKLKHERWTGDLDGMVKRRMIRALVPFGKPHFFYDQGKPKGINYEALAEFERFLNKKLQTGKYKVTVVMLPVRLDEMANLMQQGGGDLAAGAIIITPERKQLVDFSEPVMDKVSLLVVSGSGAPPASSLEDLSGKELWVRPNTLAHEKLQQLNARLKSAGKPAVQLVDADANLTDQDLMEMANAGVIPFTVINSVSAEFWGKVFDNVRLRKDLVLSSEGSFGWAFRKNSPQLKALLDEFVQGHREGTAFGNTLLRRYFRDTKYIKNAANEAEMKKFEALAGYFQKYADQYQFDYLLLAAQAYQESGLDNQRRSPVGAVGIMQLMPKQAAGPPIKMADVNPVENNIQGGAKLLRFIVDQFFNDPNMTVQDKWLMAVASYNAGPSKIAKLRQMANAQGLDGNRWFQNVELIAGKEIGQETVTYVSNVYKYYLTYKTAQMRAALRKQALDAKR